LCAESRRTNRSKSKTGLFGHRAALAIFGGSTLDRLFRREKAGLSQVKTAAEYRAMAEECFKWAREAKAKEVRLSLLQLAQVWLDAASKIDGLPATQTQSAPDAA
jgi:hypothetical protein